jgi:hypothetical protein
LASSISWPGAPTLLCGCLLGTEGLKAQVPLSHFWAALFLPLPVGLCV